MYQHDWVDNPHGIEPPDEPVQRKSLTIRDRISAIQGELANGALTPDLARESLVRLTALLGNVHNEQRVADHEYKLVLLGCLQGDEAANRARIRAEVTVQYQRSREAKDLADLVVEMIRSCKAYMRSLEEELRLAR
jgi:hypothetical protein